MTSHVAGQPGVFTWVDSVDAALAPLPVTASGMVGGTDCTTALQGFFTKAQNNGVPLIIPPSANGLAYQVSAILQVWSGARIRATGAVLDFQTDHTTTGRGLFIGSATSTAGVTDVHLKDVRVISSNATARNSYYGLISVFNSSGVTLEDCWVGDSTAKHGGEGVGIMVYNTTDFQLVRPRVQNPLADGIHMTSGTTRGIVDHPTVIGAQDDGVAIVSVTQSGAGPVFSPCRFIRITQPVVLNSTVLGSGVALNGAQDCSVVGGVVSSVPSSGLILQNNTEGGTTNPARNTIAGLVITNAAGALGAVRVANADRTVLSGVECSGGYAGVTIIGSTRTRVSGCGVSSTGASQYGVYDDTASSKTNVSGCVLDGNTSGGILLQGTGSISTGANITA